MTLKEYLEMQKATLNERMERLNESMIDSEDKEERAEISEALKTVRGELSACDEQLAHIDEPAKDGVKEEGRRMDVMANMQMKSEKMDEGTSSIEYRKAFKNYIATGKMERRDNQHTTTGDTGISTVIPENLIHQILETFEQLGAIYNLVTKTAYPVGQTIPVDGLKPTATWVGYNSSTPASSTSGEGSGTESQKKELGTAITFTHFKLRCEVRWTEEVSVMTLPMFESLFVKQVGEAMLRALEFAVVDGGGYGMPTGILSYTPDSGQALTIDEGDSITFEDLIKVEAAIPVQYESTAKWCMTKATFMHIMGMVDSNGQPIARINFGLGGKIERTILGRDVVLYIPQSGSALKSWSASVSADSIIAFVLDFSDYVLNTNYNLGISHATDWDNEDHKTKAVLACDGKLIRKTSLVTLTIDNA